MVKLLMPLFFLGILTACNKSTEFSSLSSPLDDRNPGNEQNFPRLNQPTKPGSEVSPTPSSNPAGPITPPAVTTTFDNEKAAPRACKATFSVTNIQNGSRVSIVSGSPEQLKNFKKDEFSRLPQASQDFLIAALSTNNSAVTPTSHSFGAILDSNLNRTINSPDQPVSISGNQVSEGVQLHLNLKGSSARVQLTTLRGNNKLIVVMDSVESSSINITGVNSSEIFIFNVARNDNLTCLSITGANDSGRIAQYTFGNEGSLTQGSISFTSYNGGELHHEVLGSDYTISRVKGTTAADTKIVSKTEGRDFTKSELSFTSIDETNGIFINHASRNQGTLTFKATDLSGALLNLNVLALDGINVDLDATRTDRARIQGSLSARSGMTYDPDSLESLVDLIKIP